jgi:hypothetical protein
MPTANLVIPAVHRAATPRTQTTRRPATFHQDRRRRLLQALAGPASTPSLHRPPRRPTRQPADDNTRVADVGQCLPRMLSALTHRRASEADFIQGLHHHAFDPEVAIDADPPEKRPPTQPAQSPTTSSSAA